MGFSELSSILPPATAFALFVMYRLVVSDINVIKSNSTEQVAELKKLREDIAKNNELTGRIEEKSASAHKRIDGLERRVEHLEKRCENCPARD